MSSKGPKGKKGMPGRRPCIDEHNDCWKHEPDSYEHCDKEHDFSKDDCGEYAPGCTLKVHEEKRKARKVLKKTLLSVFQGWALSRPDNHRR